MTRLVARLLAPIALIAAFLVVPATASHADGVSAIAFSDSAMQTQGGELRATATPFEFYAFPVWGATHTKMTTTFATGSASYTVDGVAAGSLTSGAASGYINLHEGDNIIVVSHVDSATTNYTIHVISRQLLQNIEVGTAAGTLSLAPVFSPTTFNYSVTVPHDVTQARIRSTWATSTEPSITSYTYWNGWGPSGGTTSGTWSNWKDLGVGSNRWCPTLVANTAISGVPQVGVGYPDDYYCIDIVRAEAFSASTVSAITFTDSLMQTQGGELRVTGTPFEFYAFPVWGATHTKMTATFATGTASYTVDGAPGGSLTSGAASGYINLHEGDNVIVVSHVDGATTTNYTIHVISRQLLQNIEIETPAGAVSLAPVFSPTTFNYSITVPHDTTQARIRSTWATSTQPSITSYTYWNGWGPGGGTTSGTWSNWGPLNVGSNRWCPTLVANTAVSGVPQVGVGYPNDYYCIDIVRAEAFNASTVSAITFTDSAMQTPGGELRATSTPFEFYAFPVWGATHTKMSATFATGSASYTVDGAAGGSLTSDAASGYITLHEGDNVIVVSHVDGATTTSYTIHVICRQFLQNIEVETTAGAVSLAPAFSPLTFNYTVTVPHDTTQARIRSTWDDTPDPSISSLNYFIGWGPGGGTTTGTWSNWSNLSVGSNRWCPTLVATTPASGVPQVGVGYPDDYYCIDIVRASAFASIDSVTVPGVPEAGTPVPAGIQLSVTPANVTGTPTPTVTYVWEVADDQAFTNPTTVATTTSATWTPTNAIANRYVRVTATADNGVSTPVSVSSPVFGPISLSNEAPGIGSASISGTPRVGLQLRALASGVTGTPTPTLTYRWEQSSTIAGPYSAIPDAGAATFTPARAQQGKFIRVVVTASNGVGSEASATSDATSVAAAEQQPVTINISGTVDRRGANVTGTTSGLLRGEVLRAHVRVSKSGEYQSGAQVTVNSRGKFTWLRRLDPGKSVWVYFTAKGYSSNVIVLRAK